MGSTSKVGPRWSPHLTLTTLKLPAPPTSPPFKAPQRGTAQARQPAATRRWPGHCNGLKKPGGEFPGRATTAFVPSPPARHPAAGQGSLEYVGVLAVVAA